MKRFAPIAFLFLSLSASADTARRYLKKIREAKSDTAILNAYNAITAYYIDINNDSADHYNRKSLDYSGTKQIDNFNFKGFYHKAELQNINGKQKDALETIQHATEIANRMNDVHAQVEALNMKGIIMHDAKQGKTAYDYYKAGYDLARANNDQRGVMISAVHCGIYFKEENDITSSLSYFIEAYPIADELKDTNTIFTCAINMGTLYERTKDNKKALEQYRKALALNGEESEDENAKAICYFKIGRLFIGTGKEDSAEYYLAKTMQIHLKRNDQRGLIFDYSFLANLHTQSGDFAKALADYDTSMIYAVRLRDSVRIASVYSYMGRMYTIKGDNAAALASYENALRFNTRKNSSEETMLIYENIAELYQKQGKYKEAIANFFLYKAWSDSSHNINETKKQTEIKLAFEFNQLQEKMKAESDAKELVNKAQFEKEKQQRYFLFAVLGLISLSLLLAIRSFRTKQKANNQLEEQKKNIEKQKEIVEDKQLEILNSFHYAKRIQDSLLPNEKYIERNLKRLMKK